MFIQMGKTQAGGEFQTDETQEPGIGADTAESKNEFLFVIEHLQNDVMPNGSFTPGAQVVITRALAARGLLAQLPDAETRSLLAVLTQLTANGRLDVTAGQVAATLDITDAKAKARLDRLCQIHWQGKPIAFQRTSETGLTTVSLSPHVIGSREHHSANTSVPPPAGTPSAGRAAVIEYSRKHYTRPRAEVERDIKAQYLGPLLGPVSGNGPLTPERRLEAIGVPADLVESLASAYTDEEIRRQLDWLPYRGAKSPARFVVAAIENNYGPPAHLRRSYPADDLSAIVTSHEDSEAMQVAAGLPIGGTAELTLPTDGEDEQPAGGSDDPSDEVSDE